MALTLTIDGTDRTSILARDTLRVEQAGGEWSAVCSFTLNDVASGITINSRDEVTVVDDGVTVFAGEVVNVDASLLSLALDGRRLAVTCRDWNALVEEAVIDSAESWTTFPDNEVIDALFFAYRPDIDRVTYVATIDNVTVTFENVTLRQAMAELCALTGGRWYVDEDKKLHYFSSEANVAAWFLSDTPDNATSFPYNDIKKKMDAAIIVNYLWMVGQGVSGWYEDAASRAVYGTRPAVVTVTGATTLAELEARANALLDKYAYPRESYDVVTRKDGLRAGMDVRLVCGAWGVDETLTVRKLSIFWRGNVRFYRLDLGDPPVNAVTSGRSWIDRLDQAEAGLAGLDGTVYDTDAPAAPTLAAGNLATGVTQAPDGTQLVYLRVTWGVVAASDLDHYTVQVSTASDFSTYSITRDHPAGGDRIEQFDGVVGNTTYYVRVRAVDWTNNASAWSATQNKTTAMDTSAPAQVVGLSAAASRTLIGLSWTANSETDLKEYKIERAPDVAGAPGAWAEIARARLNFYIDQDFTDGEISGQDTFWYRVSAVDTSGNVGTASAAADATLSQIVGDHIAALTITAANIAATTITADKMNVGTLSAIAADLGTITAGTVTGATIRTAATPNARVQLDSTNGIQAYDAANTQRVSIQTSGAGWLGASTSLRWNSAGTIQAGGWTIGSTALFNGTTVGLEADTTNPHPSIWLKSSTYGNAGFQVQYNAGTVRLYIGDGSDTFLSMSTDLNLQTGTSGSIRIGVTGIRCLLGTNSYNGINWWDDWANTYPIAQMRYQAGTDNGIIIRSGRQDVATFRAIYLQQQTSGGITTALRITDGEQIGIWESSPLAIVHITKRSSDTQAVPVCRIENDDTDSARVVLYLDQGDVDQPFINFAGGTIYTGKTEADEYVKVDAGGVTRYLRLYS